MYVARLRTTVSVIAFLVLALVTPAHARRGVKIPLQVRITAFVNEKLEGIKPDFEWVVSHQKNEYRLYILNLISMDGRATALDIDSAVNRYRVQFRLAGDAQAIQRLINTPPRQQVVITAYLNFAGGAQIMMVNQVESAPAATPVPTP